MATNLLICTLQPYVTAWETFRCPNSCTDLFDEPNLYNCRNGVDSLTLSGWMHFSSIYYMKSVLIEIPDCLPGAIIIKDQAVFAFSIWIS
jgi:hypothetical protein